MGVEVLPIEQQAAHELLFRTSARLLKYLVGENAM